MMEVVENVSMLTVCVLTQTAEFFFSLIVEGWKGIEGDRSPLGRALPKGHTYSRGERMNVVHPVESYPHTIHTVGCQSMILILIAGHRQAPMARI